MERYKTNRISREDLKQKFDATAAATSGWKDIRKPGAKDPVWYRSDEYALPLHGLDGESIDIHLIAADCADGGHGGAAFIDCLEIVDRCTNPACNFSGKSPLGDVTIPNVFTPNNDGKNERWTIKGIGPACRVYAQLWDRWGVLMAEPLLESATAFPDGKADLWDGIRKNGKPALETENPITTF